jgi:hypothetical protein
MKSIVILIIMMNWSTNMIISQNMHKKMKLYGHNAMKGKVKATKLSLSINQLKSQLRLAT